MREVERLKPGMQVSDVRYQHAGRVGWIHANKFQLKTPEGKKIVLAEDVLFSVDDLSADK